VVLRDSEHCGGGVAGKHAAVELEEIVIEVEAGHLIRSKLVMENECVRAGGRSHLGSRNIDRDGLDIRAAVSIRGLNLNFVTVVRLLRQRLESERARSVVDDKF